MFDLAAIVFLYVPLSIIGMWRWSYWLIRRIGGLWYRPHYEDWPVDGSPSTVSIVTPVYNEEPATFDEALRSWARNGVDEVIAVIDKTNVDHIKNFQERYVEDSSSSTVFRLVVTPKPGKRAALCDGIERASGQIIALVDSDTVWDDDVLEKALPCFRDPMIGGATVSQRISNPDSVGNVLFDILLWTRYHDEVPFLLGTGQVVNTLSGRTAFYRREALLNDFHDNLHDLRHEFFLGSRAISGDDKRLTHLIIQQGWYTAFVKGTSVHTPGLGSLRTFFKQRLRWTRNSWRADLRAVAKGWVWAHPALAIFVVDRFVQPFCMLIGPIVLALAVVRHQWTFVGILLGWWLVSRFLRLFGYFRRRPRMLMYLPAYIAYGYVNAVIRVYALATLVENSWATRWNAQRNPRRTVLRKVVTLTSGTVSVAAAVFALTILALSFHHQPGADVRAQTHLDRIALHRSLATSDEPHAAPPISKTAVDPRSIDVYTVHPGDTMLALSQRFGMTIPALKKVNGIPDGDLIDVGQKIVYFGPPVRTSQP